MKHFFFPFLLCMSIFWLGCPPPQQSQQAIDLTWSPTAPGIMPGVIDTIIIEDLGINDTVYVLQGPILESISKIVKNPSSEDLLAGTGYNIGVVLEQYAFQAVLPSTIRYVPNGNIVVDTLIPGPASIAAGDSAVFTATLNQQLDCAMYLKTLTIDPDGLLPETDTTNNVYQDFLFVPSMQLFNFQVMNPEPAVILEAGGPDQLAHTILVTPGSTTITDAYYATLKVQTNMGSVATSNPAPGLPLIAVPSPINIEVTPSIPPLEKVESMLTKITVISSDGCNLRQKSVAIDIIH